MLTAKTGTEKVEPLIEIKAPSTEKAYSKAKTHNLFEVNTIKAKEKLGKTILKQLVKQKEFFFEEMGLPQGTYLISQSDVESNDGMHIPFGHVMLPFLKKEEAEAFSKKGSPEPLKVSVIQSIYEKEGKEDVRECYGILLDYKYMLQMLSKTDKSELNPLKKYLETYTKLSIPGGFREAIEQWILANHILDSKSISQLIACYFKNPEEMLLDVVDWQACLLLCSVAQVSAIELMSPLMDKANRLFNEEKARLYLLNLFSVLNSFPDDKGVLDLVLNQQSLLEKIDFNNFDLSLIPHNKRLLFLEVFKSYYRLDNAQAIQLLKILKTSLSTRDSAQAFLNFFDGRCTSDERDSLIKELLDVSRLLLDLGSDDLKMNKDVMLNAVQRNFNALQYASELLKDDLEFMSDAVFRDSRCFQYAGPKICDDLKTNKDVMLRAIRNDLHVLQYADQSLKDDLEFMSKAVLLDGGCLQYASPKIKDVLNKNKDVMLKAVTTNFHALQYADESLKDDFEFMSEAVMQNAPCFQHASQRIRESDKFVTFVINQSDELKPYYKQNLYLEWLQFAAESLKNNPDFMLPMVQRNGLHLDFGSQTIKKNPDIVRAALWSHPEVIKCADESLKNDLTFMSEVFYLHHGSIPKDVLRVHPEMLKAIHNDKRLIKFVDESIKGGIDFMKVPNNDWEYRPYELLLRHGSQSIKQNREFVTLVLTESRYSTRGDALPLKYADESLQNDDYLKWLANVVSSREYGFLKDKISCLGSITNSSIDSGLIKSMKQKIKTFLTSGTIPTRSDCKAFESEFRQLPYEKDSSGKSYYEVLSQGSASYLVILLANVAIALIPFIGIMAIGAKVIHSLYTESRVSFFFDKPYKERKLLESIECFDQFAKLLPKSGG